MRIRPLIWLVLIVMVAGGAWYYWHSQHAGQHRATDQAATDGAQPAAPTTGQAGGGSGRRSRQGQGGAAGPIAVLATKVQAGDLSVSLNGLGTVTPLATVTVRPQLSGYLTAVNFTEGQMVQKGDFLAQIDPRPYQIALEQAQGQLARDQALLQNATLDLARYQKLTQQDSIARQQLDTQASLVQQYRGTILSDQAAVDTAKLDLDYCHITAPITGRVGLRQVDPGNYVQTGDATGLVIINQIQPITVIFTIPEDNIPMVQTEFQAGHTLQTTAFDRSATIKLGTGTLSTLDNQIDTTTGTVKLRAQFDNDNSALFPNQFVNVTLLVRTEHAEAIVPSAAIQNGTKGAYVYLVKNGNTVAVTNVKTGITSGDNVAVLSGLSAGDQVVVDGVDQLKDGSKVTVSDAAKANAEKAAESAPGGTVDQ
jgi:multidrug efflux system membrane fusion protein